MQITLTINVTVGRIHGKFVSKDEITEALRDELERADPGQIDDLGSDGGSIYETTEWEVS